MRPDLKSRPYRVGGRGNLLASLLGIGVYAKYDSLEFRVLRADPPPLDVGCIAGIRDRRRGDPMWSPSWAGQPESGRPHGGAPTSGRSASSPLGMASIARIRINHRGLLCVLCGESALLRLAWGPSLKIKGTAETQRRRDRVLRPRASVVNPPLQGHDLRWAWGASLVADPHYRLAPDATPAYGGRHEAAVIAALHR